MTGHPQISEGFDYIKTRKKKASDHTLFRKGNQCNKPVKGMSSTYGTG